MAVGINWLTRTRRLIYDPSQRELWGKSKSRFGLLDLGLHAWKKHLFVVFAAIKSLNNSSNFDANTPGTQIYAKC